MPTRYHCFSNTQLNVYSSNGYIKPLKIYYNNQMVVEVIHTHPGSYTIDRLSDGDIRFMNQYPTTIFTIIINSTIYDVWPTGKYVPTGVVR